MAVDLKAVENFIRQYRDTTRAFNQAKEVLNASKAKEEKEATDMINRIMNEPSTTKDTGKKVQKESSGRVGGALNMYSFLQNSDGYDDERRATTEALQKLGIVPGGDNARDTLGTLTESYSKVNDNVINPADQYTWGRQTTAEPAATNTTTTDTTSEDEYVDYTYKPGDTFGQVILDLGIDTKKGLWGSDGDVAYYTKQLREQGIPGMVPIGTKIRLKKRK